jgi:hypothetical protein
MSQLPQAGNREALTGIGGLCASYRQLVCAVSPQQTNNAAESWARKAEGNKEMMGMGHPKAQARIDYFGRRCWMCGRDFQSIDHVIARLKPICDFASNIRPACRSCNSIKGNRWTWKIPGSMQARIEKNSTLPLWQPKSKHTNKYGCRCAECIQKEIRAWFDRRRVEKLSWNTQEQV